MSAWPPGETLKPSQSAQLRAFWQALRQDPRRVGALAPSGAALARAMLQHTLAEPPGHVIEIGAGTGAITAALVTQAHRFASLHVIERDARLVDGLRRRFPGTPVHATCASQLDSLHDGPLDHVTLVSSLPFASLPAADRAQLLAAITRLAARSRRWRLLQYNYGARRPFAPGLPFAADGVPPVWTRLCTVWRNLPPATVWQLAAPRTPGDHAPPDAA